MRHEFVEYIPKELQPGTVYVSIENEIVVHSCFCGCGGRVVTPLSPAAWELTFDGDSISLYPSIGNWNLGCKSHYWIRKGHIVWDERWSTDRIEVGRRWEAKKRDEDYRTEHTDVIASGTTVVDERSSDQVGLWAKIKELFK